MPISNLYSFLESENPSSSNPKNTCFSLFDLIKFLFFNGFVRWISISQILFFKFCRFLKFYNPKTLLQEELCSDDVQTIMSNLGLFLSGPESNREFLETRFGSDQFSRLFEEEEPSLEEVKDAFDVFDENRDGFIDAMELQRVLCVLGFSEGDDLGNCRKMIAYFDENKDGRLDIVEFLKFMEKRLC